MAEDIVLRLKAENEDLKRKLEESQEQVHGLRTEVEGLSGSSAGAGDAIDKAIEEMRAQFAAARADLDRLEQSTTGAGQSTEGLGGKVQNVSVAMQEFQISMAKASGTLRALRDLGGALAATFDGLADSLGVDEEKIDKVTSRIQDLTSGSVLGAVKAIFQDLIDGATTAVAAFEKQPKALRLIADNLDLIGFDDAADGLRDMAAASEVTEKSLVKAALGAKEFADSVKNLRDEVRPKSEEIFADLRAIRTVFEEISSKGKPTEEQLIKVGEAAKSVVDQFKLIGKEVPPDIAKLAAEGKKLSDAQEKAKKDAKELAKALAHDQKEALREAAKETERLKKATESLADSFRHSDAELAERTKLLVDAVHLTEQQGTVTETTAKQIRKSIAGLIEDHKKAGEDIPPELLKIADAYDVAKKKAEDLEKAVEKSTKRLDELTKKALAPIEQKAPEQQSQPSQGSPQRGPDDDATKRVQEIRRELDALDAQQQEGLLVTEDALQRQASLQNDLLEAESDLSRQAERTGQVFFQSGQRAAEGQQRLNDLIQGAREEVKALADQLGEGSSGAVAAINKQIDAFDGFSQTVGATGTDVALFTQGVKDSLEKLKRDAAASFDETAKGAEKGKEGVEKLGDAAKDASKSAEELGDTTKTAAEHAKELGDVNIEKLPESLKEADEIAKNHLATLDQIIAKWVEINALVGGV